MCLEEEDETSFMSTMRSETGSDDGMMGGGLDATGKELCVSAVPDEVVREVEEWRKVVIVERFQRYQVLGIRIK